jgi:hypothetical protein
MSLHHILIIRIEKTPRTPRTRIAERRFERQNTPPWPSANWHWFEMPPCCGRSHDRATATHTNLVVAGLPTSCSGRSPDLVLWPVSRPGHSCCGRSPDRATPRAQSQRHVQARLPEKTGFLVAANPKRHILPTCSRPAAPPRTSPPKGIHVIVPAIGNKVKIFVRIATRITASKPQRGGQAVQ